MELAVRFYQGDNMGAVPKRIYIYKFILRIRKTWVFPILFIFPCPILLSTKGIHLVGKSLIVSDLIMYRRNQCP